MLGSFTLRNERNETNETKSLHLCTVFLLFQKAFILSQNEFHHVQVHQFFFGRGGCWLVPMVIEKHGTQMQQLEVGQQRVGS